MKNIYLSKKINKDLIMLHKIKNNNSISMYQCIYDLYMQARKYSVRIQYNVDETVFYRYRLGQYSR